MRSLTIGFVIFLAAAGCRSQSVPLGGEESTGDVLDMTTALPDHGRGLANLCVGSSTSPVAVGDLTTARGLLPGRWLSCSRPSDNLGPWPAIDFAGLEFVNDDSVTPASSGGGRWFLMALTASGGSLERIPVADAQGIFLYNPLPGPDFEQIALEKGGQSIDYNVSFADGPRKMTMSDGASFTAVFAFVGP
jgi:hypothetical protein